MLLLLQAWGHGVCGTLCQGLPLRSGPPVRAGETEHSPPLVAEKAVKGPRALCGLCKLRVGLDSASPASKALRSLPSNHHAHTDYPTVELLGTGGSLPQSVLPGMGQTHTLDPTAICSYLHPPKCHL